MYVHYNPNPRGASRAGDCVIRALSLATGNSWEETYMGLAVEGFRLGDMPSSNGVWGNYLLQKGFEVYSVPNTCPQCYTVFQFCADHPYGMFVLGTGTHVVTVINGNYYDSWDSGDEVPVYLFRKGK